MVYHYNNHFKHYPLIEGLMMEKLYVTSGKKLNRIYFFNLKNKYFRILKNNFILYKKNILIKYNFNINKNKINNEINEIKIKQKTLLSKAYKFLNKNSNNYKLEYRETNLSNLATNYFKNKYIYR
tara:strand:- start:1801 stop:2175 length:375 start_codon:yes stop_codon:yes gene_type:complete